MAGWPEKWSEFSELLRNSRSNRYYIGPRLAIAAFCAIGKLVQPGFNCTSAVWYTPHQRTMQKARQWCRLLGKRSNQKYIKSCDISARGQWRARCAADQQTPCFSCGWISVLFPLYCWPLLSSPVNAIGCQNVDPNPSAVAQTGSNSTTHCERRAALADNLRVKGHVYEWFATAQRSPGSTCDVWWIEQTSIDWRPVLIRKHTTVARLGCGSYFV